MVSVSVCVMPAAGVLFIKFLRARLNLPCARGALISSSGLNRVYILGAHAQRCCPLAGHFCTCVLVRA